MCLYVKYEGEWVDGKKEGFGKYTYASGGVYEGDWAGDERRGEGKMTWASGDKYEGEVRNFRYDKQILCMLLSISGSYSLFIMCKTTHTHTQF